MVRYPGGIWAALDTLPPLEAVQREGHLFKVAPQTCGSKWRHRHADDRCDPFEGPSHGLQSGVEKGWRGRLIGRTKGSMNSKLHAVTDAAGRPLRLFLSGGQCSDYIGARALLETLPSAAYLLADRGYDADWYREGLEENGITPCIPSRKSRKIPVPHDEARYRNRHKIENSFARLKDWRRAATRYNRCLNVCLSACALGALVVFWH